MFCVVLVLTGCRVAFGFLVLPSDSRISSSFNSHFPSSLHNLKLLAKSFNSENSGDPTVTIPSLNNKFSILATHAYTFGIDLFLTLCSVMSFCNVFWNPWSLPYKPMDRNQTCGGSILNRKGKKVPGFFQRESTKYCPQGYFNKGWSWNTTLRSHIKDQQNLQNIKSLNLL